MSTKPFLTAISITSLTDTYLMVDEYVVYSLEYMACTPTTSLALCRKSCCFISKIICTVAYCQPYFFSNLVFGGYNFNTPIFSNAFIYLEISSAHTFFSFLLSNRIASMELLGIQYQNFLNPYFRFYAHPLTSSI